MSRFHAFSSRLSSFRKRQSVPSAMIFCGLALDHAQLVQPQRIEADRVFGVVFPPGAVGVLGQRLQRIVIAFGEAAIDDQPRRHFGLAGAQIGGFQDGADHALRRHRISCGIVPVRRQHAAEILRPGPVRGGPEDHMADLARVQFLHFGRKRQIRVELALGEQVHRFGGGIVDQGEVLFRVEPDIGRHQREQLGVPARPTLFPFRSAMPRMPPWANSS